MQKPAAKNEKKYLLNARKTEFIPSSKKNARNPRFLLTIAWVMLVGQINSAGYIYSIVFSGTAEIFFGAKMAQLPRKRIGPYAYDRQ